jgi:hypothetical protein
VRPLHPSVPALEKAEPLRVGYPSGSPVRSRPPAHQRVRRPQVTAREPGVQTVLLAQARDEDAGVQQQIEELLGVTIETHEGKNGDSKLLDTTLS